MRFLLSIYLVGDGNHDLTGTDPDHLAEARTFMAKWQAGLDETFDWQAPDRKLTANYRDVLDACLEVDE